MARRTRKPRFPFAQAGQYGTGTVIHRSLVNPGETAKKIKFGLRFQSLPIPNAILGAYVDVWFFYVPYRLVEAQWADFLTDQGGTISTSTGSDNVPGYFENSTVSGGFMGFHEAYNLVINHFFRTDEDTAASGTGPHYLPNADLVGLALGDDDYASDDVTVSTAGDTLSLRDLEEGQAERRHNLVVDRIGGDYLTYLREFGVNVRNTAIDAPELLGHRRNFMYPSRTVDPSDGSTVQAYFGDMSAELSKPVYFTEHGALIGIMSIRPKVVGVHLPVDHSLEKADEWPTPWQLEGSDQVDYGSSDDWGTVQQALWHGQQLVNLQGGDQWCLTVSGSENIRFPTAAWESLNTDETTLETQDFAVDGYVATHIATPLRKRYKRLVR